MFQRYNFNGYFWDVNHGDWYASKGITGCILKHPRKNIHFFNTHVSIDILIKIMIVYIFFAITVLELIFYNLEIHVS